MNTKARVGEPILAFSAFFGISCPIRTPFHPLSNLDNAQQSTCSSQCDKSSAIFNINMEEQRYSSDNDLSCDTRNWERLCDKRKYRMKQYSRGLLLVPLLLRRAPNINSIAINVTKCREKSIKTRGDDNYTYACVFKELYASIFI